MTLPRPILNLTRERDVLRSCLALLRLRKVPHFRLNVSAFHVGTGHTRFVRSAPAGVSDVLGLLPQWSKYPGRFLALEVKSSLGKTTDEQDAFLELVRFHGGVSVVIRDVVQLDELLTDLGC